MSWHLRFVVMTFAIFGIRRFMYPCLAIIDLCAVMAVPMLALAILGLLGGGITWPRTARSVFVSDEPGPQAENEV